MAGSYDLTGGTQAAVGSFLSGLSSGLQAYNTYALKEHNMKNAEERIALQEKVAEDRNANSVANLELKAQLADLREKFGENTAENQKKKLELDQKTLDEAHRHNVALEGQYPAEGADTKKVVIPQVVSLSNATDVKVGGKVMFNGETFTKAQGGFINDKSGEVYTKQYTGDIWHPFDYLPKNSKKKNESGQKTTGGNVSSDDPLGLGIK